MSKGFKNTGSNKSKHFKYDTDKVVAPVSTHPIFCLRHQHKDFNIEGCDNNEKINFIHQLSRLSQLSWTQIQAAPKHGMGSEKIWINSLHVKPPVFITEDVKYLLAFRFNGMMPFLAHRDGNICHVIFIDPKGQTYDH